MRKRYKDLLLVFLRGKDLSVPYVILLALCLAYFIFCFNNYLQYKEIFSVIKWLTYPCIFIIAGFIYFSYELAVKMYEQNMVEYLKTYRNGLWKTYGAIILCLLTIVVIPAIMFLVFLVFMYCYIDVQYPLFLTHLVKLSVLYFGLSFVIGVMLGTAMAAQLRTKRLAVYSLTVIFVLLNTTFTDALFRIPYLLFNSYPTERVLYYSKDFFTLVPYELGSHFKIDAIYGLPMEPFRWILAVFWVLFPLTLILMECFERKTKKTLIAASCLTVLLGVGLFSLRGSTLIMDMRVNSYPFADPFYYMDRPREDYHEAGFAINKYDMDLKVDNELHAKVEVTVDKRDLGRYDFTLYHGYILTSVCTEKEAIPFQREGDYISVGSLNGADRLIFKYYGKSMKYYANRQAITLPGYFAYYPKAGRTNIWDLDRYGYVINTSPNISKYTVNVRSDLEVFCNLVGSNNAFRGKANGVSLFAGMYDEIAENLYAEPIRSDLTKKAYIREADKILPEIFKRLQRPEPEAIMYLADKKFFQVPDNFNLNSNTDEIVVMNDHMTSISCSNGSELAENIMRSIIKPKSEIRLEYDYLAYLFNRKDKTNPLFQKPVDLKQLLQEVNELQSLVEKHQNDKKRKKINQLVRETSATDSQRENELRNIVNEKAAKYLFYESPRKEENFRIFYDYYTSESKEDYLALVERIVREELGHARSKKSEQAF